MKKKKSEKEKQDEELQLQYKLILELQPDVPLIDLKALKLKTIEVHITDDELEEVLNITKSKYRDFVPPEDEKYKIQDGDEVVFNYQGRIRGKIIKGANQEKKKSFNRNLNMGLNLYLFGRN